MMLHSDEIVIDQLLELTFHHAAHEGWRGPVLHVEGEPGPAIAEVFDLVNRVGVLRVHREFTRLEDLVGKGHIFRIEIFHLLLEKLSALVIEIADPLGALLGL